MEGAWKLPQRKAKALGRAERSRRRGDRRAATTDRDEFAPYCTGCDLAHTYGRWHA